MGTSHLMGTSERPLGVVPPGDETGTAGASLVRWAAVAEADRVVAWRLTKARYAETALSGIGSSLRAGRWHRRGRPLVYAASSAALALVETLVHAERAEALHDDYVAICLRIPRGLVEVVGAADLPPDGQAWPHPPSTQALGTAWFDGRRSLALVVPSAVVPHEANVLLNPLHGDMHRVEVGPPLPFPIDARLGPVRG